MNNLIDEDDPKCLYCNGICKTTHDSDATLITDRYACLICGEVFEKSYTIGFEPGIFSFTCQDLYIIVFAKTAKFAVSSIDKNNKINYIPYFDINFSNKNSLYQKLKTYLTFS